MRVIGKESSGSHLISGVGLASVQAGAPPAGLAFVPPWNTHEAPYSEARSMRYYLSSRS